MELRETGWERRIMRSHGEDRRGKGQGRREKKASKQARVTKNVCVSESMGDELKKKVMNSHRKDREKGQQRIT